VGTGAKRETWREWQAPEVVEPPLLTRGALIEALARLGLDDIDERRLRFWEMKGVLPGPIRRRLDGATRALYPPWMVNLVFSLRHLQARGFALDDLPARMRILGWFFSRAEGVLTGAFDADWRTLEPPRFPFQGWSNGQMHQAYDVALTELLRRYARDLESFEGLRFVRAELTLIGEYGEKMSCTLPLTLPASEASPEGE